MEESPIVLAEKGKQLFLTIIARHAKLNEFYKSPDLVESLTTYPKVMISIPMDDWNALTAEESDSLAAYAASLVKVVRDNPLKYVRMPSDAPSAPQIRINAAGMSDNSWQILAGSLTPDGRDILMGDIVHSGSNSGC